MAARLGYALLCAACAVCFLLVGHRGVLLMAEGTWVTVPFGAAVLVLPAIGVWFLLHSTRFVRAAHRLAGELEAEGGLPAGDLPRTPSGRVDRAAADAVFARRRAETEASPGDWRCWFRLAVAYHDARDTPRARRAMHRAIALRRQAAGRPAATPGRPPPRTRRPTPPARRSPG